MLKSTRQHTLKAPVTISGIGVHSGAQATMTLKPAPASSGISFIRTDITDRPNAVPAQWDRVTDTQLCTVLSNGHGVSVSTVEHLLSAFAALGVDNATVEINGPEIPIMDGSAIQFLEKINIVGLSRQSAPRRALRVKKTVSCKDGDKETFLSPADGAYFGMEIDFTSPLIGCQKYTHELTESRYRSDIAPARTFGFLKEVEHLKKLGLARGGSLENAIVIDGDKVLNPEGLRFRNEFVRHKILDAIGDIYLAGAPLIGHYHGVRAGHAMNNKILRALFAQPDTFEFVTMGEKTHVTPVANRNHAGTAIPA
ncbi:MAG: UDP-3-O-acyl-N-acetylglucosamine deacetylase [Alphaproteobacteria bacterium]|nr:UDP-3-O-acyl-N-acetylglucosamine deacetylase [Alphaproteobacteria bacterium]MDE2336000.1 UDP-3-O-acyl-N-acetylglucosamine deacetylase [Alphaproteobacteria bacterium]